MLEETQLDTITMHLHKTQTLVHQLQNLMQQQIVERFVILAIAMYFINTP